MLFSESLVMEHIFQQHGNVGFLDNFFIYLAAYSSYFFALLFAAIVFYCFFIQLKKKRGVYWTSLLLLPVAILVNKLLRELVSRERPFMAVEEFSSLIYHHYSSSFPSNHAAASFAIAGILYLINPKWGKLAMVLALLVSISRVYVGVHYPSDIAAGAFIALILLYLFAKYRTTLEQQLNTWGASLIHYWRKSV